MKTTNSGLPKGVQKQTLSKRFTARLNKNGKVHYLGAFDTPEEAHRAYEAAANDLDGKFAAARNKTGLPKGVFQTSAKRESYFARIQRNGKRHYLGTFNTPEEAHEAYCKAASTPEVLV